ncbi:MAG: DUF4097 family beta strand repeat-containing protein [Bryobacteraceae bacterium]
MKTICMRALPLMAALALVGCDDMGDWGNSERFKEDFHSTYPLNAGGTVSLENFNGAVEVFGWDQNSVDVSATKYASTKEQLDAIKIDVTASPTSVRIRTIRPSSATWHGNLGARYTVRVPKHVQLDSIASSNGSVKIEDIDGTARLRTSNGAIHATKLHGELEARTSNGSIDADDLDGNANLHTSNGAIRADATHGSFEAGTSNGSIVATLTDPATNWPVKAHSSNGKVELTFKGARLPDVRAETSNSSLTLRLPANSNARVRANTSHSSITSDFDVLTRGTRSKTELEGTIGSGGPSIDVSSSNGSIRITKI